MGTTKRVSAAEVRSVWEANHDPMQMIETLRTNFGQARDRRLKDERTCRLVRLAAAAIFRLGQCADPDWNGANRLGAAADRLDVDGYSWADLSWWLREELRESWSTPNETVLYAAVLQLGHAQPSSWARPLVHLKRSDFVGFMLAVSFLMQRSNGPAGLFRRSSHWPSAANVIRDVFPMPVGTPQRWMERHWRTDTVMTLARTMYESREFSAAPILADALQDAGCDAAWPLEHLRSPHQSHVRGCWVLDDILGAVL